MSRSQIVVDGCLAVVLILWGGVILGWVPPAQPEAGAWAQKIFYLHVPASLVGYVGFSLAAFMGCGVLFGEERFWDLLLVPTVEVTYLFACLVLLSGPIWARPVWGRWWSWEPQLTSFLILWLTYGGWFLFRAALPPGSQQRFYSAIYAVVASLNIVVVIVSVKFWAAEIQAHPDNIALDPRMSLGLFLSMGVMLLLFARLLWVRTVLEQLAREVEGLRLEKH